MVGVPLLPMVVLVATWVVPMVKKIVVVRVSPLTETSMPGQVEDAGAMAVAAWAQPLSKPDRAPRPAQPLPLSAR